MTTPARPIPDADPPPLNLIVPPVAPLEKPPAMRRRLPTPLLPPVFKSSVPEVPDGASPVAITADPDDPPEEIAPVLKLTSPLPSDDTSLEAVPIDNEPLEPAELEPDVKITLPPDEVDEDDPPTRRTGEPDALPESPAITSMPPADLRPPPVDIDIDPLS